MTIMKYRTEPSFVAPFNELMNEFFGRDISHFLGHDDLPTRMPRVNIVERAKDFRLDLRAPGYQKGDMKIQVEDGVLTISAEKKMEDLKEGERYTRREFALGTFARSFRMPEGVDAEQIKAEFNDGVLSVVIPKTEVTKPKSRAIDIR